MGKSKRGTRVELLYKMADSGKTQHTRRAREHDKTKYRWPVLAIEEYLLTRLTFNPGLALTGFWTTRPWKRDFSTRT